MKSISIGAIALSLCFVLNSVARAETPAPSVALSESYTEGVLRATERYVRLSADKPCMQSVKEGELTLELVATMNLTVSRKLHQLDARDASGHTVGKLEIVTGKGPKKFTVIEDCRYQPSEE